MDMSFKTFIQSILVLCVTGIALAMSPDIAAFGREFWREVQRQLERLRRPVPAHSSEADYDDLQRTHDAIYEQCGAYESFESDYVQDCEPRQLTAWDHPFHGYLSGDHRVLAANAELN